MLRLIRFFAAAAALVALYLYLRNSRAERAPDARDVRALERADRWEERPNAEPVLGYDGMDLQTVVPWLEGAGLDLDTLLRIREYEQRNQARETVLNTIDDLMQDLS